MCVHAVAKGHIGFLDLYHIYGSVRLITLLNMCNGTEGKKTAVWGWWGALGNLVTAPLEETPYTHGTTWQHTHKGSRQCTFFFTKVRRQKNHDIVIFSGQNTGSLNRGTEEKKPLHRHGCASGFPKIHPKLSVDLKEISSGRQAVFQRFFFSNGTENPL